MPIFNSIQEYSDFINKDKTSLLLYTDGSCYKGKGGWGYILKKQYGNILETLEKKGEGVNHTTISRMEMTAILMGILNVVEKGYKEDLYVISDSQFIVNSFNKGWYNRWKETNFISRPNDDLWKLFSEALPLLKSLHFVHTRGHEKGMEFHKEGNTEVDKICSYKNFFTKK